MLEGIFKILWSNNNTDIVSNTLFDFSKIVPCLKWVGIKTYHNKYHVCHALKKLSRTLNNRNCYGDRFGRLSIASCLVMILYYKGGSLLVAGMSKRLCLHFLRWLPFLFSISAVIPILNLLSIPLIYFSLHQVHSSDHHRMKGKMILVLESPCPK